MDIMLLTVSALLLGDPGEPPGDKSAPVEYDGSAGQLDVETPRMTEAEVDIDGRLDEAVWADAALLHSFTQYDARWTRETQASRISRRTSRSSRGSIPSAALSCSIPGRRSAESSDSVGARRCCSTGPPRYPWSPLTSGVATSSSISIERQPLLDPASGMPIQRCDGTDCSQLTGTDGYDIHVEALVSYEPSPGTVMYIGYSREMEDTGSFRFRQVRPQADGLVAKLSYRFRY